MHPTGSGLAMTGGGVIARERSDRGDLLSEKEPDSKAESGLRGNKIIGAGNDRRGRHREGAKRPPVPAKQGMAIYRLSCSSSRKQNEASPCFQSAVPRTLNWRTRRVEGTIHPSITLSTVPSTSPYDYVATRHREGAKRPWRSAV